ncbi:MAG: curli production assembly protein CsgG [Proteobacteria bacterium]|nr:curli production assembly protein CsgG [Pseudomonadota bacterium]
MHRSAGFAAVPISLVLLASGCAIQTPPVLPVEAPQSVAEQRRAQQAVQAAERAAPVLKRKIAIGRVTNETAYGRTLLRDRSGDPLGKQVSDMFARALVESGQFIVLERPDIERLQSESRLTGSKLSLVGVDSLVLGSLTEFGRRVVGETGFLSQSKRQVAFAKVDFRIVDATSGLVSFSVTGAGEASTETASSLGFGSQAAYDGTLNDAAIRIAVSEAVSKLSTQMIGRTWFTEIIAIEQGQIFISGGTRQGLRPDMSFAVETKGRRIKSPQSGFEITLPGREVARVQVVTTFGTNETDEGSIVRVLSGSLEGHALSDLVVVKKDGQ